MHLPLLLTPVSPDVDSSGIPFAFAMAAGVHKGDSTLRDAVSASIARLQPRIDEILGQYHVPLLPIQGSER
jgi:hypothetical protein